MNFLSNIENKIGSLFNSIKGASNDMFRGSIAGGILTGKTQDTTAGLFNEAIKPKSTEAIKGMVPMSNVSQDKITKLFKSNQQPTELMTPPVEKSNLINGVNLASSTKGSYAEDPLHEEKVTRILDTMQFEDGSVQDLTKHIKTKFPTSPLNGKIITEIANSYGISPNLLAAVLQNDSGFGTTGMGSRGHNPGNVGNYGNKVRKFKGWWEGVDAAAYELKKRVESLNTTPTE